MLQLIERNPTATNDPVNVPDLADHLRVELAEAMSAMRYARAAADEIEHHTALALLTQEIVATGSAIGTVASLPIGPVQAGALVTVERIEEDGSTTPIASGWHLIHGRYPSLRFDVAPEAELRVTYTAGYGTDYEALPRDLSLAILDQAIRLYDRRGDMDDNPRLAPSTARICARYRRVAIGV
ncbi:MAG: hypothetical protein H5U16_01230 [Roseovarius sp.]|nr:hypothetical protein [Roseovarius sp.]